MNAGRKYLGVDNLAGKVFVTSGLGGMSGAQAKASIIAGCVGVIAEVTHLGSGMAKTIPSNCKQIFQCTSIPLVSL